MRHLKKVSLGVVALSLLLLTGCQSDREAMIQKGYPPAYADGFDDGCGSGKKAGGDMFSQFAKDVDRYHHDKTYREGWDDGYKECRSEQAALQKQIDQSIEQQKLMEQKKHDKKMEEKHMLDGIDTSGLENLHK